jgi:hypothetical protein
MTNDEMHGLTLTPGAVDVGVFQEHLKGMQRGNVTSQPTDLWIPPPPTTQPHGAPAEPGMPAAQQ